jgi:formylglycine-generating enzyme required for sulfatase activity
MMQDAEDKIVAVRHPMKHLRTMRRIFVAVVSMTMAFATTAATSVTREASPQLATHLEAIARLAPHSPMVAVPAGWFLMGSQPQPTQSYSLFTPFDDTEQPRRRVWLDAFDIDRDETSLGEYLAFLGDHKMTPPDELQRLIWHLITVHVLPDYVLASWPALYVTWSEAVEFCHAQDKRLPTEAQWEKAARGPNGNLFPWGSTPPAPGLAVFGQHHVHEIPLVASVQSGDDGQSPYGVHHMAGNIAEWVQDWLGIDYYAVMPDHNPRGPASGRYKSVRGGSWKSHPAILRSATRNGAVPHQRAATVGFRCAR